MQQLINRVSEEHATVAFAPHLTVCGVPGDLAVLDAAATDVRECGLLPLRVAKIAVTGAVITPFRAVFIEVENSRSCVNSASGCATSSALRRSSRRMLASSTRSTGAVRPPGPIPTPSS